MSQTPKAPEITGTATREWENEGGAVNPALSRPLPEGVTAVAVTQYRVGSYAYTSLDDALAEHRRQTRMT